MRCCTQLAKLGYFTPCRAVNFMLESPLRSKASSKASLWAKGVRTRPSPSVFKITDSAVIDVIGHTYDIYAIPWLEVAGVTLTNRAVDPV